MRETGSPLRHVEHFGISPEEHQVLAAVHRFGLSSYQTLARLSGIKPHTLRSAIERLISAGIVTPFSMVNTFALGLKMFPTYLSFEGASLEEEQHALKRAADHPSVNWVARFNGHPAVGLSVLAPSAEEALVTLGELNSLMGLRWSGKSFIQACGMYLWPIKWFGPMRGPGATLMTRSLPQAFILDELDHRILSLKQEQPLSAESSLARALDVPEATTSYRLRRLENAQVLAGNGVSPCWDRLGLSQLKVLLSLKVIDPLLQDELVNFGFRNSDCIGAVPAIGSWDFEFNIVALRDDRAHLFTGQLYAQFGDRIQDLSVLKTLETIKECPYHLTELAETAPRRQYRA